MSPLRPLIHNVQTVVLSVEQKTKMTRKTKSLKRNNNDFCIIAAPLYRGMILNVLEMAGVVQGGSHPLAQGLDKHAYPWTYVHIAWHARRKVDG
jgi:hypothetical protein